MKKTLTVLMMVLITAMLFVSCGEDPFFHTVSIKDGDKVVKTEIVRDGEEYTLPEKVDGIEVISGWTVEGKSYSAGEKIKVTSDITITAVTKTYKVTFDLNGGTGDFKAQTVEEGKTATKPDNPTKAGYDFARWSATENGETAFDFSTEITKDTILYAVWTKEYEVGDKGPAGGYIFYVNSNAAKDGWKYLEAAPGDLSEQYYFGFYRTSDSGEDLAVDTSTEVGTGKSNTENLVKAMGDEAYKWPSDDETSGGSVKTKYAAKACADYTLEGYDDWFLPSKDELHLMYTNLKDKGKGGTWKDSEGDSWYWSSSEKGAHYSYKELFYDGTRTDSSRIGSFWVRPVRSF